MLESIRGIFDKKDLLRAGNIKRIFLKKKDFIVIELGEFNLKAAVFSCSGAQKKVQDIWTREIASLSLKEKEDAFVLLVKDKISAQTLKNSRTFFVVPESSLITRRITIPAIPLSEITSALKFHLKDEIAWDMEETAYVWKIVQEKSGAAGVKKLDLVVSFILKEKINDILKLSARIGVSCYGIHSQFFSLVNLFNLTDIQGTVGVLDIGGRDTSFMILRRDQSLFLRRIFFSSDQLNRVIMESSENSNLSFEEVERIKKEQGLSGQIFSYMRPTIEKLIWEIKRSIEYYNAEFEQVQIDRIYLLGAGSQLKGLNNVLGDGLKLKVESFFSIPAIEAGEELDREKLVYLPALLGAIYEKRMNFLSKELRVSRLEEIEGPLLKTGIPVLSLVFLILFLNANFQLDNINRRLKYAEIHLGRLRDIRRLKEEICLKDNLLDKLVRFYIPGEWVMKSISTYLPAEMVLEKMDFDLTRGAVSFEGLLSDTAGAEEILTAYAKKLRDIEIFKEVNVVNIVKIPKGPGRIVRFQMNCSLIDSQWLK